MCKFRAVILRPMCSHRYTTKLVSFILLLLRWYQSVIVIFNYTQSSSLLDLHCAIWFLLIVPLFYRLLKIFVKCHGYKIKILVENKSHQ